MFPIYYINLEKRKDRLIEIQNELTEMELINNATRFNAIDIEHFGILGCLKSHCEVLKIARDLHLKNVIIMEDDFTFIIDKTQYNELINRIINENVDYDVIMFSYNLCESVNSEKYDFLKKVLNATTASCYLVNGAYLQTMINLYEIAMPLLEETQQHWFYANDVIWQVLMEKDKWFATNTRMGIQRPSHSNISNEFKQHNC